MTSSFADDRANLKMTIGVGKLSFSGCKKYGLQEYYILKTRLYDHDVSFYLENDTYLLGRMVFSGITESGVAYTSTYDFSDPISHEGITMPGYWMHTFLGAEGMEEGRNRIEELALNTEIDEGFWEDIAIHFGTVHVDENIAISGNIVESYLHQRLQWMIMPTNIRWEDIEPKILTYNELGNTGLKGVRDRAIIITKYSIHHQTPGKVSDVTERLEASLERLGNEYVDIAFFYHGVNDPAQMHNDVVMEAAEKLKKEGKIRFTGFSTHNAVETLAECVNPEHAGFLQAVLFIYNHIDGKPIEHLVKKVHDAGISTIVMKSQAGGKQGNLKSFVNEKLLQMHRVLT